MPESTPTTNRARFVLFLLFAVAVCGNYLRFSLVFGLDFLFGSIAVLLIVYNFGTRWGVAAAIGASLSTWILWGHPYAVVIFAAEALFVGLALRRSNNMLLLNGIFWLFVGMPLVWILYSGPLGQDSTQTSLVMLKDAVNGIFNALIASLLVTHAPLRDLSTHTRRERLVPLGQAVFNLCVGCVLLPTLLLLFIGSRHELQRVQQQIQDDLLTQSAEAANTFEIWQQLHISALQRLAQSAGTPSQQVVPLQQEAALLAQSFPDFRAILVLSEAGRSLASYSVESSDGQQYLSVLQSHAADEEQSRRSTGRSILGRISGIPVVLMTEPLTGEAFAAQAATNEAVLNAQPRRGVVAAALDVSFINRWLKRSLPSKQVDASIVNPTGKIVASIHEYTDTRQIILPDAQNGEKRALGQGLYHWLPHDRTRPAVERWTNSVFLRETSLRGTNWTLLLETPLRPHQAHLSEIYLKHLLLVMILLVATLLMASVLSRGLTSPLSRLAQQTTDLPSRLLQDEPPRNLWHARSPMLEIDVLMSNFQSMAETLQHSFGEREAVRRQLEIEQQRLTEANRLKDEFLAILSHELRTPLVPIIGYADLIVRGVLKNDDISDGARSIERNARAQLRLIEDLLDVSRIITGKLNLRVGLVSLDKLVRDSLDTVSLSAQVKDIELSFEEKESIAPILGDEARLRQVIWNLLSNAVKFTPNNGRVQVTLLREGDQAKISITDNGAGIAPEFLPFVFDRFRQAGDHLTRSSGGLGLGLAIVRHVVELHGGTVEVFSAGEGDGTTFTVRLPLPAHSELEKPQAKLPDPSEPVGMENNASQPARPAPNDSDTVLTQRRNERLKGAHVLVIDDEADGRRMLMAMLRLEGAEVSEAASAEEALRMVQSRKPNAIVCDIGMPAMDGYDFLRALRENSEHTDIHVIAFTAYTSAHDKKKVLTSGFEAYLSKPADAPEVAGVLQMLIDRH